jgi:hypothetical protein
LFFNCHLLLRLPYVSNLSAIFCNSCSIFLLAFCSQLSLLYPPDSISRIISYLPVLIFLFPFCALSSASCCLTNLREVSHYVRIFTVFGPLFSSSEYNFIFIFSQFYIRIVTVSTFFRLFFSFTRNDWAHCRCVSVLVPSSGSSNIFLLQGERLAVVLTLTWYQMLRCTIWCTCGLFHDFSLRSVV